MVTLTSEFIYVRNLVNEASGIYLDDDKEYLARSRITSFAKSHGFDTYESLIQHLRTIKTITPLHREVIELMMTNETFFFREPQVFKLVEEVIIPDLIKKREAKKSIKILSLACSTGQEPYSLGMSIDRTFPSLREWKVEIIGADYSTRNLEKAKQGFYQGLDVKRGISQDYIDYYFRPKDNGFVVNDRLQDIVSFRELNLKESWPYMGDVDLVLLRNVLIYFDKKSKEEILAKAHRAMARDGYLLIGSSETMIGLSNSFKSHRQNNVDYYTKS